jgi:hypothetical protein
MSLLDFGQLSLEFWTFHNTGSCKQLNALDPVPWVAAVHLSGGG